MKASPDEVKLSCEEFMESGIVENQGGMRTQLFTQQVAYPLIDERGIGGAGKQHGR